MASRAGLVQKHVQATDSQVGKRVLENCIICQVCAGNPARLRRMLDAIKQAQAAV